MRLRRHCYDKAWRCPGWAGGGWKMLGRHEKTCDGGSLARYWANGQKWYTGWQFHRCLTCGTVAMPIVVRWADPTWWKWMICRMPDRFTDWRELREHRRERRERRQQAS